MCFYVFHVKHFVLISAIYKKIIVLLLMKPCREFNLEDSEAPTTPAFPRCQNHFIHNNDVTASVQRSGCLRSHTSNITASLSSALLQSYNLVWPGRPRSLISGSWLLHHHLPPLNVPATSQRWSRIAKPIRHLLITINALLFVLIIDMNLVTPIQSLLY